jgi:hypothetical protein
VCATSAALGFVIGAFFQPHWTDNVESAQVLAGLVRYAQPTPLSEYHASAYSLSVQLAAILLKAGLSEWTCSVLFSGLQGALSFAALSTLGLAVSESHVAALLMPVLFLRLREWSLTETTYLKILHGHRYPGLFPNDEAIYGVLGLFWILLVLGLLGQRRVKTAAFLLGVMPAVHAGLAPAAFVAAGVFTWALGRERREWIRAGRGAALAGLVVFGLSAAAYLALRPPPGPAAAPEQERAVMAAFLGGWEDHNPPVPAGEWTAFLESEIYTATLALALLTILRRSVPRPVRALAAGLLGIVAVGVSYTLILGARPDLVPWRLRLLLIMRWLNVSSFAFPVIALGLLARLAFRRKSAAAALVLLAVFALVATGYTRSITAASFPGEEESTLTLQSLAFPVTIVIAALALTWLDGTRLALRHGPVASFLVGAAVFGLAAVYLADGPLSHLDGLRHDQDEYADALAAARGRPGLLLVCDGLWSMGRPQIRTRRGLPVDPTQLNMLLKVPSSAPRMREVMRKAYDVDLMDAEPQTSLHAAWPSFTLARWRAIRRDLGVTDVLAPESPNLALPKLFSGALVLYTIPP